MIYRFKFNLHVTSLGGYNRLYVPHRLAQNSAKSWNSLMQTSLFNSSHTNCPEDFFPGSRIYIASHCMDIHRNPRTSKWISIKAWVIKDWHPLQHGYPFMDINCLRISIAECPWMDNSDWISMRISTLVWIIEDGHPKIMGIHFDIRGFLEIHVKICYRFSDQGSMLQDFLVPPWKSYIFLCERSLKYTWIRVHLWHEECTFVQHVFTSMKIVFNGFEIR